MILKEDKDSWKKVSLQAHTTHEYRCKNPEQILGNRIQEYIKIVI